MTKKPSYPTLTELMISLKDVGRMDAARTCAIALCFLKYQQSKIQQLNKKIEELEAIKKTA